MLNAVDVDDRKTIFSSRRHEAILERNKNKGYMHCMRTCPPTIYLPPMGLDAIKPVNLLLPAVVSAIRIAISGSPLKLKGNIEDLCS
jgi:hypothetical protein